MLNRLDLDMALTGNVEIARDMRDIAQEKMALMKLQIHVLQNTTPAERTAATSSTDNSQSSTLGKSSTTPNLPLEEDDDEATQATETDSEHDQPTQGAGSGTAAQPAQDLPGMPIDAG